jgi:hypothetical protein
MSIPGARRCRWGTTWCHRHPVWLSRTIPLPSRVRLRFPVFANVCSGALSSHRRSQATVVVTAAGRRGVGRAFRRRTLGWGPVGGPPRRRRTKSSGPDIRDADRTLEQSSRLARELGSRQPAVGAEEPVATRCRDRPHAGKRAGHEMVIVASCSPRARENGHSPRSCRRPCCRVSSRKAPDLGRTVGPNGITERANGPGLRATRKRPRSRQGRAQTTGESGLQATSRPREAS